MSLFLFWSATALIIYTYIVFPAVVFLRGRLVRRPYQTAEITPKVSMIIAAHNEARSIGAKLDNILSLDYPREQLEVIIVSDGSNDGTETIVHGYADQGVRLLALPRQGKAPALNTAVAAASGEILVFSDANSMYAPPAIRALTRPFADPEVGGVAGNQVYLPKRASTGASSAGEHSYWNFDRKLKQSQSTAGNAISATGAIYAIRRSLFQGVPLGVTDDFATSTSVIAQGYRLVFAPDAIAYEPAAQSSGVEFGRKTRVITRGLRGVLVRRELLNPFRYGFYALQLFSHKVLRRLAVFPLLGLLLVSPLLWSRGRLYKLATLGQAAFYGLGLVGWLLGGTKIGRKKIFSIPFFFCMVNAASFVAALNLLRGKRIDFWEPQREDATPSAPSGEQRMEIGD
jgi:cellulose synthase/poly-beta-1,6-N-acetylglucosamine synthase-like glycosyltransferase